MVTSPVRMSFPLLVVCVCVTCMWRYFCWMSTCGDQSLMVGCPYLPLSTSFLWQSLSLKLEFTVVRLAGRPGSSWNLSVYLSTAPVLVTGTFHLSWSLMWWWGLELRPSCLSRILYPLSCLPGPWLLFGSQNIFFGSWDQLKWSLSWDHRMTKSDLICSFVPKSVT